MSLRGSRLAGDVVICQIYAEIFVIVVADSFSRLGGIGMTTLIKKWEMSNLYNINILTKIQKTPKLLYFISLGSYAGLRI